MLFMFDSAEDSWAAGNMRRSRFQRLRSRVMNTKLGRKDTWRNYHGRFHRLMKSGTIAWFFCSRQLRPRGWLLPASISDSNRTSHQR